MGVGLWARQPGPYFCTQPFLRPGITGLITQDGASVLQLTSQISPTRKHAGAQVPATRGSEQHENTGVRKGEGGQLPSSLPTHLPAKGAPGVFSRPQARAQLLALERSRLGEVRQCAVPRWCHDDTLPSQQGQQILRAGGFGEVKRRPSLGGKDSIEKVQWIERPQKPKHKTGPLRKSFPPDQI